MYSQMLCLNNWDVFHNPAEKDCSPGRRCGGDCEIFLESGCAAGGNANTMFALAGKRHGWQRKGGPVMMRSTSPLSFRKSTVVASIWVHGGQSFLRGFYGPLRYEPCPQFINVSQRALHIYFIDGCRRIKIERNNLLCEQAPTEVFRSIFAWLVTFNSLKLSLPEVVL